MKTIIGNFKTNLIINEFKEYAIRFEGLMTELNRTVKLALPYTHLCIGNYIFDSRHVEIGGQDIYEGISCTGEINAQMLKSTGASFVILGHSDRRKRFKESDRIVNKKIKLALAQGLKVVLCVGEEIASEDLRSRYAYVREQLEGALRGLYENELESITIAYEPVYAIGTGKLPNIKTIEGAIANIRRVLELQYSQLTANNTEILYGGSVNERNVKSVINAKGVDGILVGGTSIDPDAFFSLIKEVG